MGWISENQIALYGKAACNANRNLPAVPAARMTQTVMRRAPRNRSPGFSLRVAWFQLPPRWSATRWPDRWRGWL